VERPPQAPRCSRGRFRREGHATGYRCFAALHRGQDELGIIDRLRILALGDVAQLQRKAAADLLPEASEHKREKLRAASARWGRHTGITAKLPGAGHA
jgi:hypothetical protein